MGGARPLQARIYSAGDARTWYEIERGDQHVRIVDGDGAVVSVSVDTLTALFEHFSYLPPDAPEEGRQLWRQFGMEAPNDGEPAMDLRAYGGVAPALEAVCAAHEAMREPAPQPESVEDADDGSTSTYLRPDMRLYQAWRALEGVTPYQVQHVQDVFGAARDVRADLKALVRAEFVHLLQMLAIDDHEAPESDPRFDEGRLESAIKFFLRASVTSGGGLGDPHPPPYLSDEHGEYDHGASIAWHAPGLTPAPRIRAVLGRMLNGYEGHEDGGVYKARNILKEMIVGSNPRDEADEARYAVSVDAAEGFMNSLYTNDEEPLDVWALLDVNTARLLLDAGVARSFFKGAPIDAYKRLPHDTVALLTGRRDANRHWIIPLWAFREIDVNMQGAAGEQIATFVASVINAFSEDPSPGLWRMHERNSAADVVVTWMWRLHQGTPARNVVLETCWDSIGDDSVKLRIADDLRRDISRSYWKVFAAYLQREIALMEATTTRADMERRFLKHTWAKLGRYMGVLFSNETMFVEYFVEV